MARFCRQCARPRLNLTDPVVLERARTIASVVQELGEEPDERRVEAGWVMEQQTILRVLQKRHNISHGTGQHYIDALHTWGFLEAQPYGAKPRRKRVRFVAWPETPSPPAVPVEDPGWPDTKNPLEGRGLM